MVHLRNWRPPAPREESQPWLLPPCSLPTCLEQNGSRQMEWKMSDPEKLTLWNIQFSCRLVHRQFQTADLPVWDPKGTRPCEMQGRRLWLPSWSSIPERKVSLFYWFLCLPQCPEEALGVPGSGCSPAVIAAVLCRSAHTSCGNMKNAIQWKWEMLNQICCMFAPSRTYLTSPNVLAPFGLDIGRCVGSNRGSPKNQRWNRLGKLCR